MTKLEEIGTGPAVQPAASGEINTGHFPDAIIDFLKEIALSIRYIGVRDDYSEHRTEWINQLGLKFDEFDFSMNPEIVLSPASSDYDILFIGTDDTRRAINYIKQNRDLYRNKILICLARRSDPKRRAKLVLSGFDDVFDVSRTSPSEALARLVAFKKRYDHARMENTQKQTEALLLESIVDIRMLSPKQQIVIEALVFAPGRNASYSHLCSLASDTLPISPEHLKVIVSNIRKFLKPPFKIVSDRMSKYHVIS